MYMYTGRTLEGQNGCYTCSNHSRAFQKYHNYNYMYMYVHLVMYIVHARVSLWNCKLFALPSEGCSDINGGGLISLSCVSAIEVKWSPITEQKCWRNSLTSGLCWAAASACLGLLWNSSNTLNKLGSLNALERTGSLSMVERRLSDTHSKREIRDQLW